MFSPRANLLDAFRERGLRCTSQRYAILEYLTSNPIHPSAEEIFEAINRRDPRASLATVYKALHALSAAGLIRELSQGGNANRFEARSEHHHHFVCEQCGRIEDISWFEIPRELLTRSLEGRKARACDVVLRGLCCQCAAGPADPLDATTCRA